MNTLTLKIKRWLRNAREVFRFVFVPKNPSGPDNHIAKISRIRRYRNLTGAKSFLETGTFYGQTTEIASYLFDNVVSIELSSNLAELNALSFRRSKNVRIVQGDSRDRLHEVLIDLPQP